MADETNFCNTKNKRGRPRLPGEQILICVRFRTGRSEQEDVLFERLQELGERGQRSRYIRRVLLTGDIEPVLESIFQEETARVQQGLDAMFDLWEDEED